MSTPTDRLPVIRRYYHREQWALVLHLREKRMAELRANPAHLKARLERAGEFMLGRWLRRFDDWVFAPVVMRRGEMQMRPNPQGIPQGFPYRVMFSCWVYPNVLERDRELVERSVPRSMIEVVQLAEQEQERE